MRKKLWYKTVFIVLEGFLRSIFRDRCQKFFRIEQFESRKWALWVCRIAGTLMFSVHSSTNVLIQSIRIAQTIIQPVKKNQLGNQ